jgi:hypothetical protein
LFQRISTDSKLKLNLNSNSLMRLLWNSILSSANGRNYSIYGNRCNSNSSQTHPCLNVFCEQSSILRRIDSIWMMLSTYDFFNTSLNE